MSFSKTNNGTKAIKMKNVKNVIGGQLKKSIKPPHTTNKKNLKNKDNVIFKIKYKIRIECKKNNKRNLFFIFISKMYILYI